MELFAKMAFTSALRIHGINSSLINKVFDYILSCYSAKDRFYHNTHHIENMVVSLANRFPARATKPKFFHDLVLAIIFHDIIYVPGAKDNEEKSAQLASKILTIIGYPRDNIQNIMRYIRCTQIDITRNLLWFYKKDEAIPPDCYADALIADLDLEGFLKSPEEVKNNNICIELEFMHLGKCHDVKAGCMSFLRTLYDSDRIFHLYNECHEKTAKSRLKHLIEEYHADFERRYEDRKNLDR